MNFLQAIQKLIEQELGYDVSYNKKVDDCLLVWTSSGLYWIYDDHINKNLILPAVLNYNIADPSFDPQMIIDFIKYDNI